MEVVTNTKRKRMEVSHPGTKGKRRKRFRTHQAKGLLPVPLPDEIISHIMSFLLRPDDALRFMATCKRFYNAGRWHTPYWRQYYPVLKQVRVILPSATHTADSWWRCKALSAAYYDHRKENPQDRMLYSDFMRSIDYATLNCGNPKHYDQARQPCPPEDIPPDACNAVLVELQKQHHRKKRNLIQKLTRNLDTLKQELITSWEKKNYWDQMVRTETDQLNDTKAHLQAIESGVKKTFIKMPKLVA
jgi:hypothetical protein